MLTLMTMVPLAQMVAGGSGSTACVAQAKHTSSGESSELFHMCESISGDSFVGFSALNAPGAVPVEEHLAPSETSGSESSDEG